MVYFNTVFYGGHEYGKYGFNILKEVDPICKYP